MLLRLLQIFILFLGISISCLAGNADPDQQITQLIQSVKNLDLEQRIVHISGYFLSGDTTMFSWGEGASGQYDQQPLYRLDEIDCTTFIEMVLAMSLAHDLNDFKSIINRIRYRNGEISFINRNHFAETDWVPNNTNNGFIQNITEQVAGKENIAIASTYTDKKNWYRHLTLDRIHLANLNQQQKLAKLNELRQQSRVVNNVEVHIVYLPLTKLFPKDTEESINHQILNKIPNGAIVMIVRKNWPNINKFGTHILISHMNFAIWKNGQLYLRMASKGKKQTLDLPLIGYLGTYIGSATVVGISIFKIHKPT